MSSEQAADVLAHLHQKAKPAQRAQQELAAYAAEISETILKQLKVPHTRFKLVDSLGQYNPRDVATALDALVKTGRVERVKRDWKHGGAIVYRAK